jgi:hypothetical protein
VPSIGVASIDHDDAAVLFAKIAIRVRHSDGKLGKAIPAIALDMRFDNFDRMAPGTGGEAVGIIGREGLPATHDRAGRCDQHAVRGVERGHASGILEAQWGVADHWSPPFETLQTHRGDCEDYAIVKYVALLQAGLSHDDVKIVILRNLLPKEDHAVVAARVDGQWLILDNRRLALVRDTKMVGSIPKFVLDEDGTRRFVPSNRAGQGPSAGRSSPARFVRPA